VALAGGTLFTKLSTGAECNEKRLNKPRLSAVYWLESDVGKIFFTDSVIVVGLDIGAESAAKEAATEKATRTIWQDASRRKIKTVLRKRLSGHSSYAQIRCPQQCNKYFFNPDC
jgi:hypothetical protein